MSGQEPGFNPSLGCRLIIMLISCDVCDNAHESHVASGLSGSRYLNNNNLMALDVGVFDKNTALTVLYVGE